MNQSFFKRLLIKRNLILPTLILFALSGLYFNQILPDKWFIKYSININIKLLATSQAMEKVFEKLDLKSTSSLSLEQFLYDEIGKDDIRKVASRFQNISKPYINKAPLELAFHSSDVSNTDQEVKIIVDELDNRLRPKITEWISAYKHIGFSKLNINKSSKVKKKQNQLDFFNEENDSVIKNDLLEICKIKKLAFDDEELDENEKEQLKQLDEAQTLSMFDFFSCYANSIVEYELNILEINDPEDFEYLNLLMLLESDINELKVLDSGRIMTKFNKKPSMISSIIAFLILGIFFIILIFLLNSKSSKKLMTKMSTTLLNLK